MARSSDLETFMAFSLKAAKVADFEREYVFRGIKGDRKWRFDFAWPDRKIALEVDGGAYSGGRHTRSTGFTEDCRKLNEAAVCGWRVARVTGEMVTSGEALVIVEQLLEQIDNRKEQ